MLLQRFSTNPHLASRSLKPCSRHDQVLSHSRRLNALKRVIEPAYFQDIFDGAADRIFNDSGFLKREETMLLVESVSSMEHVFKSLELIVRHLENRAGTDINDWHHRKKYYMRLCELTAIKLGRPEAVLALFGNLQRFQISTYFGKEAILKLGPQGLNPAVLLRIAELCKMQRGPSDKGVRTAYSAVIYVLQSRALPGDTEILAKAQADQKALRTATVKVGTGDASQMIPASTSVPAATSVAMT
ncbi:hypothetical protein CEUSTIGMA_g11240.t1 [Chlamydomonas eustigma]|uniref:Uncharacterized protein n=1 Tax=Chlamydomonas eustigma TaxID=1157962 RepID=A0A250XL38_9CHLO|nr:hypothetical protein CEUSTIGMA_g11240.t1 [Chlamydomonas eustigma]|eukprot:GAX83815.1 hypothetical protein CEUSTIGMA_g11240.t1 [Chlamydomonas eustigma]